MSGPRHAEAVAVPRFRVTDVDTSVAAVRAAGGQADDPQPAHDGHRAECIDDQGFRFQLVQR